MTVCQHLEPFLDDALSNEEKEAFIAHLKECGGCRDQLEKWSEITSQFATWVDTRENSIIPEPEQASGFIKELSPRLQDENPAEEVSSKPPGREGLLKRLGKRLFGGTTKS